MPDEAITAAQDLGTKVDRLTDQVGNLADTIAAEQKSAKRWRWLTIILITVCVVTLGLVVAVVVNVRYSAHQAECVRTYTNQNADRNNTIFPFSQAKNDAQDAFVTALAAKDEKQIDSAFTVYVKAVRDYQSAQASNPLPLAPRYTC